MKPSILIRRVVIAFISLCVAFILITVLVNLPVFDEELRPEVANILLPLQIPPHENNAYIAIWGISAAADKDIVEAGVRLVERYHHNREENELDALTPEDYVEILGTKSPNEEWLKSYSCNARTQLGCLSIIRASLQAAPVTSQRSQLLLDRHQYILQMSGFGNWADSSYTSTTPLPPYISMLKLSQLKLANLYDSDSSADFLKQLAIDMRFWRMMLEHGSELIDKMFGIAGIWTDVQYLSEYMAIHKLSQDEARFVRSLLNPLTRDELNLENAFKSEQRTLFKTLAIGNHSLPDFGPLVNSWLIQTNATQNSYYQHITKPVLDLSVLSGAEFATQTHSREQQDEGEKKAYGRDAVDAMTTIWPGTLYNLGGKIFLSKMLGYPADYIARVHDLNSMIGLVNLQLSLQSEEVESIERVLSKLDSASPHLSEALVDKALKFDPEGGWLQFDCLYKASLCKIKLYGEHTN